MHEVTARWSRSRGRKNTCASGQIARIEREVDEGHEMVVESRSRIREQFEAAKIMPSSAEMRSSPGASRAPLAYSGPPAP